MKLANALLAVTLLLSACGKNAILDTQEDARDDMKEELVGTWTATPEAKQKRTITITKDTIKFEITTCRTVECVSFNHTVAHTGSYVLAHNYKTGINNSIIFTPNNEIEVTLHDANEVKTQNNNLIAIRNAKEDEYGTTDDELTIENTKRKNEMLRATKTLKDWVKGQPQVLTRHQLELLNASYGLAVSPVAEQGSRVSIRYELDNKYLQIGSAASNGRPTYESGDRFGLNGVFAK